RALIAGLSHKHTELLYLQPATPRFNRQPSDCSLHSSTPPHHPLHTPQPP
ncbi:Hypothetical predicted protein, partial [Xyrichtys novacula]